MTEKTQTLKEAITGIINPPLTDPTLNIKDLPDLLDYIAEQIQQEFLKRVGDEILTHNQIAGYWWTTKREIPLDKEKVSQQALLDTIKRRIAG